MEGQAGGGMVGQGTHLIVSIVDVWFVKNR